MIIGSCAILSASAAPRYSVTDLGTLGGDEAVIYAINNRGQIVGGSDTGVRGKDNEFLTWVFLWQNGRMQKIAPLPGRQYYATGINDVGTIVGAYSANPGTGRFLPYVYQAGKVHLLRTGPAGPNALSTSTAYAINASGLIAGDTHGHACLWKNGRLTLLPQPARFATTSAVAINKTGWAAGNGAATQGGLPHAVPMLWKGGTPTVLPLPEGYSEGEARGVNDRGQVIGWAARRKPGVLRTFFAAWLWQGGKTQGLPSLPGLVDARAFAINARGEAVGHGVGAVVTKRSERALLWRQGRVYDLNRLVPPRSGWALEEAQAINDRGWIIGNGKHDGKAHAFLLRPLTQE